MEELPPLAMNCFCIAHVSPVSAIANETPGNALKATNRLWSVTVHLTTALCGSTACCLRFELNVFAAVQPIVMKTKMALLVLCTAFFVANTFALRCNVKATYYDGFTRDSIENCSGNCGFLSVQYQVLVNRIPIAAQIKRPVCLSEEIKHACNGQNIWPKLTVEEKRELHRLQGVLNAKGELYCCASDECNESIVTTALLRS
ncbi:hypothetical protein QR680_010483 [Steinernema hermaphroditum]|uniref:Uncharacterized protein n=1 Tax=Steinernema hermaphroditum TaxID=289476 RepID=A0AA39IQL7_9BILA|nr:hypothetical protein QR680_010483 [Steinernema hermaphroditum]